MCQQKEGSMESTSISAAPTLSREASLAVLRQLFRAIWIARGAGEDVSQLLFTLDLLLPPALLQEVLRCIDQEGIAAYYCADSAARFHIVKCSSPYRGAAWAGFRLRRSTSAGSGNTTDDDAASEPPRFFLVTPDFCSCEGTEYAAIGYIDASGLTCAHRIAVEMAEALDGIERRRVLERDQFSRLLLAYSHEVLQQQYCD